MGSVQRGKSCCLTRALCAQAIYVWPLSTNASDSSGGYRVWLADSKFDNATAPEISAMQFLDWGERVDARHSWPLQKYTGERCLLSHRPCLTCCCSACVISGNPGGECNIW